MNCEYSYSDSERIKTASQGLYHPVAEELGQPSPAFGNDAEQVLKCHGVYQQDNRDIRTERKRRGLEPDYCFMVRIKAPAGRMTATQYLRCDQLADIYGKNGLRVTSRQGLQFHGVRKSDLRPLIHDLNVLAELTTLGAAGDVVRNVIAPPLADIAPCYHACGAALMELSQAISRHFLPGTRGYHEIWADDSLAAVNADGTVALPDSRTFDLSQEPIYGAAYLPRKFKIALCADFDNSVDAYTNDVGLIAITNGGRFSGFEAVVGGGLGHVPRQPDRIPELAQHFAFVTQDDVIPLLDATVKVFREHGNRGDRHRARLRHLIGSIGMEKFRELVEATSGRSFLSQHGIQPFGQLHYLGWSRQIQDGLNYVGIWLENGCICDVPGKLLYKTALREAVALFSPEIRYTPHHNIILAQVRDADVEPLNALLLKYGIDAQKGVSPMRQWEMACPALPYCPRALSEAERAIPSLLDAVEREVGADADLMIRMSGCSNSCSRPRTAELGVIAKNSREYLIYAGGNRIGTRLNELIMDNIPCDMLASAVICMIRHWHRQRNKKEDFGDWAYRAGAEIIRAHLTEDLVGKGNNQE